VSELDLTASAVVAALDAGGDDWLDYENAVIEGPGKRSLEVVLAACAAAPDDRLCWIGVTLVEALLDLHWREIGELFLRAAESSRAVRRALSCSDRHIVEQYTRSEAERVVARAVEARLEAVIGEEDDIGRRPPASR
jgi:hypothetical protein